MHDWEKLVTSNARSVYRVALRILGNQHDAEDVAQDVFCEALKLFETNIVSNWPGMLRRLATLRAIDRLRYRRPVETISEPCQPHSDPSQIAVERELAERLRHAITQLPKQQAAVFSLMYLERQTRDEIAACLDISTSAVSTALYKARQKLKSLLELREVSDG